MAKTDTVFELIKTLSKGEKRNLMQLAKLQSGEKDYVRLFQRLDEMSSYDDALLKSEFSNFSYTKNYLYNFILRSLTFHEAGDKAEVSRGIRSAYLLMDKKLHQAAKKLVRSLKKMVVAQELFADWDQLLDLEIRILRESQDLEGLRNELPSINAERRDLEEKRRNLHAYERAFNEIFLITQTKYLARGEVDLKSVDELESKPLNQSEKYALSLRGEVAFFENRYRIDMFRGDYQAALVSLEKLFERYSRNKYLIRENTLDYLAMLGRISGLFSATGNYKKTRKYLEVLGKFKWETEKERVSRFENYYSILFPVALDFGDFDFALKELKKYAKEAGKLEPKLTESKRILLHFQLAKLQFFAGDSSEAYAWVKKVIDMPKTEVRQDVQAFSRLLNLLIQLERGDADMIEFYQKSSYKYFQRRKRLFKFESAFLSFINKVLNSSDFQPKEKDLRAFKKKLEKLFADDPGEKAVLSYFDIMAWLDSKLEGISLREAVSRP